MCSRDIRTAVDPVLMTITSPHHLIHAIPYLLGFRPSASMVLVWIRGHHIVLTQRYDLAAPDDVDLLQRAADHVSATKVAICAFPAESDHAGCAARVGALAARFDHVIEAMVVFGDRWWRINADGPGGEAVEHRLDTSDADAVAVAFIAQGIRVRDSRHDLEAEVAQQIQGCAMTRRALEHLGPARASADEAKALYGSLNEGSGDVHTWARVVRGLQCTSTRDEIVRLMMIDDPAHTLRVAESLSALLSVTPTTHVVAVAPIAALARWLCGDGARAWACLDRAQAADPDDPLTLALARALAAGLPPRAWRAQYAGAPLDSPAAMG